MLKRQRALSFASFCLAAAGVHAARAEPNAGTPALGDTPWALPGLARVGVPGSAEHRVALAAAAGYGYTEAIGGQDGANHRAAGAIALGVIPTSWLELALRLDGRYDVHPSDERGKDYGGVGDPRVALRIGQRFGSSVHAGIELDVWFPGADAPSFVAEATTLDARGLVAWRGESGLVIGVLAGFRFDQSAAAEERPDELRLGDRIALGLSDSSAVLAGIGVAAPFGQLELVAELSADLLVGSDAPELVDSPLRVTAGARYHLSRRLEAAFWLEASLSGRPGVGVDDPMVPIEPRASGLLGVSYRWGFPEAAVPPAPVAPPPVVTPVPAPTEQPEATTAPPPPEPAKSVVSGRVRDESGQPVPDAHVRVVVGEQSFETRTAAEGEFQLELPAAGEAKVTVSAEGFDPGEGKTALQPGRVPDLEITVAPAVPAGQLKGLVRSFDGRGMRATIRIERLGVEVQADESGAFEINVPPGKYEVEIEAQGYASQRRTVRIENRGVTVLNADLRAKR